MLVLTRKARQEIHVGNDVTITVLGVKGRTVRLGISAPEGYRILRGELAGHDLQRPVGQVDGGENPPAVSTCYTAVLATMAARRIRRRREQLLQAR